MHEMQHWLQQDGASEVSVVGEQRDQITVVPVAFRSLFRRILSGGSDAPRIPAEPAAWYLGGFAVLLTVNISQLKFRIFNL